MKIDKKKQKIYDIYRENLNILIDNGFYKGQRDVYLCPICLEPKSLEELTLEDYPPKSVGGKANLLTCQKCNNKAGRLIDFHLSNILKELSNDKSLVKVEFPNGEKFNAFFHKEGKIIYENNRNNPKVLKDNIIKLKANDKLGINFIGKRDNLRIKLALLKTAYLFAFEKFGYALMLDKNYDAIRHSIINNNTNWVEQNLSLFNSVDYDEDFKLHRIEGAFIMKGGYCESLYIGFKLEGKKIYYATILLPIPNRESITHKYMEEQDTIYFEDSIKSIRDITFEKIKDLAEIYSLSY